MDISNTKVLSVANTVKAVNRP